MVLGATVSQLLDRIEYGPYSYLIRFFYSDIKCIWFGLHRIKVVFNSTLFDSICIQFDFYLACLIPFLEWKHTSGAFDAKSPFGAKGPSMLKVYLGRHGCSFVYFLKKKNENISHAPLPFLLANGPTFIPSSLNTFLSPFISFPPLSPFCHFENMAQSFN